MILSKILKNTFLVLVFGLVVTACATKKTTTTSKMDSQIQYGLLHYDHRTLELEHK